MSYRITKIMGEAFKLHSQALVGYEATNTSRSAATTPTQTAARPPPAADLEMEATVY